MVQPYIKIPITVLVPRKPNRQDSIFYGTQPIAQVTINNRKYVLTTAGTYNYSYQDKKGAWHRGNQNSPCVKRWTNRDIKNLDKNRVDNWGWFGINIWKVDLTINKETFLDSDNNVWSTYDEAMEAFINFVERNITNA
jgi:hypothetical protein